MCVFAAHACGQRLIRVLCGCARQPACVCARVRVCTEVCRCLCARVHVHGAYATRVCTRMRVGLCASVCMRACAHTCAQRCVCVRVRVWRQKLEGRCKTRARVDSSTIPATPAQPRRGRAPTQLGLVSLSWSHKSAPSPESAVTGRATSGTTSPPPPPAWSFHLKHGGEQQLPRRMVLRSWWEDRAHRMGLGLFYATGIARLVWGGRMA